MFNMFIPQLCQNSISKSVSKIAYLEVARFCRIKLVFYQCSALVACGTMLQNSNSGVRVPPLWFFKVSQPYLTYFSNKLPVAAKLQI